jgi:hypothetical protein
MAIAMEFFNIIVPKALIGAKYPGGVAQYEKDGGPTFLEDEYLTRGGAMNWFDVEMIIRQLEKFGFRHLDESGKSVDIVVVDMLRGPMTPCDWIEFDSGIDGPRCWLRGTAAGNLSKPNRPDIEKDRHFAFLPNGRIVPIGKPTNMSMLEWLRADQSAVATPGAVSIPGHGSIYVSWASTSTGQADGISEQMQETQGPPPSVDLAE